MYLIISVVLLNNDIESLHPHHYLSCIMCVQLAIACCSKLRRTFMAYESRSNNDDEDIIYIYIYINYSLTTIFCGTSTSFIKSNLVGNNKLRTGIFEGFDTNNWNKEITDQYSVRAKFIYCIITRRQKGEEKILR